MNAGLRGFLAAATCLPLAACGGSVEEAGEPVVVAHLMEDVYESDSAAVINTLIAAFNNERQVDPANLTESDWTAMEAAVERLRDATIALRDGSVQVVAEPGETIDGEDSPGALSAADVQARIDADPASFKAHAASMLVQFERMTTAVEIRDTEVMWDAALKLDPECRACHAQFWWPDWYEPPGQ